MRLSPCNPLRKALLPALLLFCLSMPPSPANAQEIPKHVLDHVRSVSVSLEWNGKVHGSGTLFDRDDETWCLTANHVVKSAEGKPIRVTQYPACGLARGKAIAVYAEVAVTNCKKDFALLKLGKGVFGKGASPYCSCCKLELDSPVVHCGSMTGLHHTISRGYLVWHDRKIELGTFDQIDLTAAPGSSGGGVFDTQGHLIGMVVAGQGQRIIFMVPIRHIELGLR